MVRVVVTARPGQLISLEDAKVHLRVAHSSEDALIDGYIAAASARIDGPGGMLGRSIGVQELRLFADSFASPLLLPYGPVDDVDAITYLDANGASQTLPGADYVVAGDAVHLRPGKSWPSIAALPEAVQVDYIAGGDEIDPAIIQAVRFMVGDFYAQRETFVIGTIASAVPMSAAAKALLEPFRVWGP